MELVKRIYSYFSKHPRYNSLIHVVAGIGIGILLTHPMIDPHTIRWGLGLLVLGFLGHLYPLTLKK